MSVQDDIKKLRDYFSMQYSEPAVLLAYLFGSRVDDSTGPLSDTDIAVLYSENPSDAVKYRLCHELAKMLDSDRIDLVVLNCAPVELKYAVIASGILLYEKSPAERVEFEAHTLSRYGDYLPVLRRQRREIIEESFNETGVQRYRTALGKTERVLEKIRAFQKEVQR
jgi:hypothetical protein